MENTTAGEAPENYPSKEAMLQAFCAVVDTREHLKRPIRSDGYLYATNGHICLAIKDDPAVPAGDTGPDFGFLHKGIEQADKFSPLDAKLPPIKHCRTCGCTGKTVLCKICEGEGEFDHGSHTYECKECDGDGYFSGATAKEGDKTELCFACDGYGVDVYQTVKVGHTTLARRYVALLQTLPGVVIWTNKELPMAVAFFKFDGGFGAVMPCRED